jgi:hypothetical protein
MPLKQLIITLWVFITACTYIFAQQDSNHRFGFDTHYGFIIPHAADLVAVSQSNPVGFNLYWEQIGLDKKRWDYCNCFHYLGINLSYHNFNNPEVLGSATALSGTFEPILWKSGDLQLSLRSGFGVSYLSKVYDEEFNPNNTFFSSPISFLLNVSPRVQYQLQDNFGLNLALQYNHISNGGQKQPNRGMNFPTIGLGINYTPKPFSFPTYTPEKKDSNRQYYIEVFGTLRSESRSDGRQPLAGVTLGGYQRVNAIQGVGLGFESQWDNSLQATADKPNRFIHAPYFAHHFLFGNVDFSQRMGIYIQKPAFYEPGRTFYQRYVLSYLFNNSFKIGAALKVHGHVAENIEVRLGYQF